LVPASNSTPKPREQAKVGRAANKFGNKSSFKPSKITNVPAGEAFIQHWKKLLESRAWRSLSRHAYLALWRLEAEHCNHAGKENGSLIVLYDQFEEWGIPRKWIKPTLTDLVNVGLLVIERQGIAARRGDGIPSLYRLTYLPSKHVPIAGSPYYLEPTNDWTVFENPNRSIPPRERPAQSPKSVFSVTPVATEPVPLVGTERTGVEPNSADPLGTPCGNYYIHYGLPYARQPDSAPRRASEASKECKHLKKSGNPPLGG
jgi:hypothetical protein